MEKLPHGRPSHGPVAPVDEVRVCTLPFVRVAMNCQLCVVVKRRERGRRRRERNMMLDVRVRVKGQIWRLMDGVEDARDDTWVVY